MVLVTHPSCAISDLILLRKLHFFLSFFGMCVFMNGTIRDYVSGSF